MPTDKLAHFGLSYVAVDALVFSGVNRPDSELIVSWLDFVKEVSDPVFDTVDLASGLLGVVANNLLH